MEFVIWGITPLGKYLANNTVYNHKAIRPLAYIDNNIELQNTLIDGVPVTSYHELMKKKDFKDIIVLLAVKNARNIFQILEQVKDDSLSNLGIVNPRVLYFGLKADLGEADGEIIWNIYEGKKYRVIPRLEVNLTDACNLKCKGCTHFSSIYKENSIYPFDDFERDLHQVRNIGKMVRLRLLGGEPFLLKNLDEYTAAARGIFPESDIEIVTNGLLIPEADARIMSSIKSNDASITISPYQPTLKLKDKIAMRLNESKVPWHFDGEEILQFSRSLTLENTHNAEASNAGCLSSGCTLLRKGKIYKCPFDGLMNDFYAYYGLKGEHNSGTDIYQNGDILYKKLMDYALKPVEMCRYCAEKAEYIPWSVKADPLLEDWLYQGQQKDNI